MNIFLTLYCGHNDSAYFIQPFSKQELIEKVFVFRDKQSLPFEKVIYVTSAMPVLGNLNFVFRLFQMLLRRNEKPAVIIGIYEIPHGLIAVLASKLLNRPSVVSMIGNPAYRKLRKGLRMKLTLCILRNATFITVTGNTSKAFLETKNIASSKIFVLPNTLDFTGFLPVQGDKEYDLVSLGRICREKRVDLIVRVISELTKTIPNIRAAIGGSGPGKKQIMELIQTLGLERNITMPGYVPDNELTGFYNKGRIFILTSETEGFPRTIIQAAACGIPVVASNVGDITDVIDNNVNGFLVSDPENVEEYSDRILQLLSDTKLYNKFSTGLNRKVREKFVSDAAVKVWYEIISKVSQI